MNNVGTPETMKDKYEKLFGVWSTYKNTLEDAEIMLIRKRNEFANSLMEKRTGIKIKAKNLSRTFLETAPISTEWKSNGIYEQYCVQLFFEFFGDFLTDSPPDIYGLGYPKPICRRLSARNTETLFATRLRSNTAGICRPC